jgi:glycolate oxidase iron-sulfur subunit
MSREILARKMGRIVDTGAEMIATACPACLIQLADGSRWKGLGKPVRHVIQLLAERI